MGFVKFTNTGKSFTPRVSISKSGLIGLNNGARNRFGIEKYQYCVLYYDADEMKIGIEFTGNKDADGVQKIRFRNTGADIAGKSFLSFFGIDTTETRVYPIAKDDTTGYLVVNLSEGVVRGKSKEKPANRDSNIW